MAIVIITGSNSGFGFEGALAFARNGDTVYATMRDVAKGGPLQLAADEAQLALRITKLDVSQPRTFESFIKEVTDEAGGVDVLVNNAGVVHPGALEDLSESALRQVMEINFFGPMLLTKSVLPQMRKQRSGLIIMTSSLSGMAGLPGELAYTASKFALEGATEALRHEIDRWGIKLALVEAGMYATGLFDPHLMAGTLLPDEYPEHSPYRPLIESQLRKIRDRLPEAFHPRRVGDLFVTIAQSDGAQLRWPADEVATKVLGTVFAQDDAARDAFLRMVSATDWWSEGRDHAD